MSGFILGRIGQGILSAGRSIGSWLVKSGIAGQVVDAGTNFLKQGFRSAKKQIVGGGVKAADTLFNSGINAMQSKTAEWMSKAGKLQTTDTGKSRTVPADASTGAAYKNLLSDNVDKMTGGGDTAGETAGGGSVGAQTRNVVNDPANSMRD